MSNRSQSTPWFKRWSGAKVACLLAAVTCVALALAMQTSRAAEDTPQSLLAQGEYEKAIDEFETRRILGGDNAETVKRQCGELRVAFRQAGPRGYWAKSLEAAEKEGDLYSEAVCQACLGNYDEAFRLLDEYCAKHEPSIIYLYFDECWDNVRSVPRFVALLKKIGLRK